MARKTIHLKVCDLCESEKDVEVVSVRFLERKRERRLDVCAKCRAATVKPWEDRLNAEGPRHGPRITRKVVSEADVAAAGKPRRKVKR